MYNSFHTKIFFKQKIKSAVKLRRQRRVNNIWILPLHKKWSFPLTISSVNVTKSTVSCGFGHIYWRNPQWKTLFLCRVFSNKLILFPHYHSSVRSRNLNTVKLLIESKVAACSSVACKFSNWNFPNTFCPRHLSGYFS